MRWNRRDVFKLMTAAAAAVTARPFAAYAAPEPVGHPDPSTFASGDLIWPALPNTYIPYEKELLTERAERTQWIEERSKFLSQLPDDEAGRELRERVRYMTYTQFRAFFMQDGDPAAPQEDGEKSLSLPRLSVGHVGIIEIDRKGNAWVVEAMPKSQLGTKVAFARFPDGVIRTAYRDWIKEHADYNVWHGRVNTKGNAGLIVAAAKSFLGRDYWIWALNFSDETAFYCSKLVWVSVYKAFGVPLDGDATLARQLWLSPKRLMKLDAVTMLYSPAPYGE